MRDAIANGQLDASDKAEVRRFRKQVELKRIEEVESPPASDDEEGRERMREKRKNCLRKGLKRFRDEFAQFRELKRRGLLRASDSGEIYMVGPATSTPVQRQKWDEEPGLLFGHYGTPSLPVPLERDQEGKGDHKSAVEREQSNITVKRTDLDKGRKFLFKREKMPSPKLNSSLANGDKEQPRSASIPKLKITEATGFEMTSSLSGAVYSTPYQKFNKDKVGTGYTQEVGEASQSLLPSPTRPSQRLQVNGRNKCASQLHSTPSSESSVQFKPAETPGCIPQPSYSKPNSASPSSGTLLLSQQRNWYRDWEEPNNKRFWPWEVTQRLSLEKVIMSSYIFLFIYSVCFT